MTDQRTEVVILNIGEARNLTNEVKLDAVWLWRKLLRLYRGGAHTLLGYSSWAEYCAEEFDMGKSQAYRLLDSGRVMESLDESPNGERPASEAVARELVPVVRRDPERILEVWGEVVERHGPAPTAAQVRNTVTEEITKPIKPLPERSQGKARRDLKEILLRLDGLSELGLDRLAPIEAMEPTADELADWDRHLTKSIQRLHRFRGRIRSLR